MTMNEVPDLSPPTSSAIDRITDGPIGETIEKRLAMAEQAYRTIRKHCRRDAKRRSRLARTPQTDDTLWKELVIAVDRHEDVTCLHSYCWTSGWTSRVATDEREGLLAFYERALAEWRTALIPLLALVYLNRERLTEPTSIPLNNLQRDPRVVRARAPHLASLGVDAEEYIAWQAPLIERHLSAV